MISFRPAESRDMPFVMSSWLKSFKTSNAAGLLPFNLYYDAYRLAIQQLLDRGSVVYVAYVPGEDEAKSDIYGWACVERGFDKPLVHYVYVKQPYRRLGVAKALLRAAGVHVSQPFFYTYRTPIVAELLRGRRQAVWMPVLARSRKAEADESEAG